MLCTVHLHESVLMCSTVGFSSAAGSREGSIFIYAKTVVGAKQMIRLQPKYPKVPLQNKFYLICKMTYCVPAALHLFSSLCPRCSPHHHHRHRQLLTDQKGQLIWKSLLLLPTQIFLATASFFGTSSASSFHLNSELV